MEIGTNGDDLIFNLQNDVSASLKGLTSSEIDAVKSVTSSDLGKAEQREILQTILSPEDFASYVEWTEKKSQKQPLMEMDPREVVMNIANSMNLGPACEKLLAARKFAAVRKILNIRSPNIIEALDRIEQNSKIPSLTFLKVITTSNMKMEKSKLCLKFVASSTGTDITTTRLGHKHLKILVKGERQNLVMACTQICRALGKHFDGKCRATGEELSRFNDSEDDYVTARESMSPLSRNSDSDSDDLFIEDGVDEELLNIPSSSSVPDSMNILFLGATGVGKSTAINALVNYLKHPNMDEAVEDPTVLIRTSFYLNRNENDGIRISQVTCDPTVCNPLGVECNESKGIGESSTQDPRSYLFTWKQNGVTKSIQIIDTPGIGDTRGIDYDKKNFDKIMNYIADFSEIHAICILLHPDSRRLSPVFRFCIDELLVHLHQSAARNIQFYFTSTRATSYEPGPTFNMLKSHLNELYRNRNVVIKMERESTFLFDNEGFKYICAVQQGLKFSDEERKQYEESYSRSVKETQRWLNAISLMEPHKVSDTLCLNNTRVLILTLSRPMAEISRNISVNRELLEKKVNEIEKLVRDGANLDKQLFVDQEVISTVPINFPKTVCTATKCVEYKKFHPDSDRVQVVYKTVCHDHCYLKGVEADLFPNPALQACSAMNWETFQCLNCGCSWQSHIHIRYEITTALQKVIVKDVESAVKNKSDQLRAARNFVSNLRTRIKELNEQTEKIINYSAAFSLFLQKNSIIPYNDSYRDYLDYLISQERDKAAISGDASVLKKLERDKAVYTEHVSILKKADENLRDQDNFSISQVNQMIDELKNMPFGIGSTLDDVQKLVLLSVRQTRAHKSVVVHVTQSLNFAKEKIRQVGKAVMSIFS